MKILCSKGGLTHFSCILWCDVGAGATQHPRVPAAMERHDDDVAGALAVNGQPLACRQVVAGRLSGVSPPTTRHRSCSTCSSARPRRAAPWAPPAPQCANELLAAQTLLQLQAPAAGRREDMSVCVKVLEAALLLCLPTREVQAVDRSLLPAHRSMYEPSSFHSSSLCADLCHN
jgi:hypothetical protein